MGSIEVFAFDGGSTDITNFPEFEKRARGYVDYIDHKKIVEELAQTIIELRNELDDANSNHCQRV